MLIERAQKNILGTLSDTNFEIWCILTVPKGRKTVTDSDTKGSLSNEHLPCCYYRDTFVVTTRHFTKLQMDSALLSRGDKLK